MFPWQDYNPDYFVDRPAILKQIREWADAAEVEKRVLSIVAPPGGGKTWILKKLYTELINPGDRFVAWVDIPKLVNSAEKNDRNRMINRGAFTNWFTEIRQNAQKHCPHVEPISTIPDFPAMISTLVRYLCNCNLDMAPLVIVDGYDEINERQAEVISLRLLERLIEQPCIRLLIAHRAEWAVKGDSIRRNQQRLLLHQIDPLSKDFALRQFDLLTQVRYSGTHIPDPNIWLGLCQHYLWSHPLINHFLFVRGLEGKPVQLRALTNQDFYECCKAVIERPDTMGKPRYPSLTSDEFGILHQIATQLDPEWSQAGVEALLNVNFYQNATIAKLFDLGLIVNVSESLFYRISPGLRELLCEIDNTQLMPLQRRSLQP